jgi:hypothetical protein
MKNQIIFFIFFICFSLQARSQFEASKRKVNISALPNKASKNNEVLPKNNSVVVSPSIKFESKLFKNPDDNFLRGLPAIPRVGEKQIPKNYPLINPSQDYTDKLNEQLKEDGIRPELFNRDMNLGQFVVYTQKISLNSRDYGVIDGDLVRVWLNGQIISNQIYLESKFKEFILNLEKGMNVIEIEALNYGDLSPNTGQFTFFDDNKELVTNQYWNLGIGYKARILIEYKDRILMKK